ncbi:MAG TPA: transposase [Gemmataceae bacterium]|nr:transposase [Gemmataceae bacterium]
MPDVFRRPRHPHEADLDLRAQRGRASGPSLTGAKHRGHAASAHRPPRPLRGLLRGRLRLRPLPRRASAASGPCPRRAPRSAAADPPVAGQERPQGRGAAGDVAVPGRGAGGARALARRAGLARGDQLPQPGNREADAGQEHRPRSVAWRGGGAPAATRLVDEGGAGLAPPIGPAHALPATPAGPADRGDRGAHPPGAAGRAAAKPAGAADTRVARLRSIPGVGIRTAAAVAAFVDDPQRFPNAKVVGRYFGLVPCQDQSGDKNRLGRITREGAPVVRQLVAEAALQAQRRSPTVRAYFERTQRGDPQRKKIARVATPHYLVRVMWALLKRATVWEEGPRAGQGAQLGLVRRPRGKAGRRRPRRSW